MMHSLNILYCYIRMYRTFADAEGLRGLPHRSVVVDDIIGYPHSSFFNIVFLRFIPLDTPPIPCYHSNQKTGFHHTDCCGLPVFFILKI